MKKSTSRSTSRIALILIALIVIGFGLGWGGTKLIQKVKAPSDGEYDITVCATTDVHGCYFDKDFDGVTKMTSLGNVSTYLKELRGTGVNPVLIDVGDNLQGTNAAYYYNYVATEVPHVYTLMQHYLKYDALVVGNHDVETGHPVYDRLYKEAGIPMLAANAVYSEGKNAGKPYFDEYTIIKRGKIKIAIIGMTNANIKGWLTEPTWKGIDFLQLTSMAQEVVDKVNTKEKPHITIVAVHSGRGAEEYDLEDEALRLAETLHGVNLVLCGHDHHEDIINANNPSGNILLVDSGCKARFVSRTDLKVKIKDGKAESVTPVAELVKMDNYEADPEFVEKFAPYYDTVLNFASKPICTISEDIDFCLPLEGPNAYVSLIHKAQLDATGADISFAAPLTWEGGVKAGSICWNDISKLYRFENTLTKTELTGKQIKNYLEYSYDGIINKSIREYNFDTADGINYTVDLRKGKGERISITGLCDGRPFSEDATYSVALTSYRFSGGGHLLEEGAGVDPKQLKDLGDLKDIRSIICDYMLESTDGYKPICSNNWTIKK